MNKLVKGSVLLSTAILQDIHKTWIGQFFTIKPTKIQLLVNDICDSRCIMCNIWQRGQKAEISLEELTENLSDQLFNKVHEVVLSGGEPTLCTNIPEIGKILVNSLPRLKNVQIITNAANSTTTIENCLKLSTIFQMADIHFSVSVSLDGVEQDHDQNRGIAGNFASAVEVIKTLTQNGLPVSISCTLTPINCYGADDILIWCQQNEINNWQFRPAIDINNYYNDGYTQHHPLTVEQHFHEIMFFDKLARYPGLKLPQRLYYRNLVDQMSSGKPRSSSCIWQTSSILLSMRGKISFCPTQSLPKGCIKGKNYIQTYRNGIPERHRIVKQSCDNCQYDSIGELTTGQLISRMYDVVQTNRRNKLTISNRLLDSSISTKPAKLNSPKDWQRVLITGWYGTETTGDKAILGELLYFIKHRSPNCEILLTTLDQKISHQTNNELDDLNNVHLIDINKGHQPGIIESVDAVIMGGGPLMETKAMENVWRIFSEANRQSKARVIFGCGIGPLNTDHMVKITAQILQLSTAGFFRDEESYEYSKILSPDSYFGVACDPALSFMKRWTSTNNVSILHLDHELRISTLLRANTNEFIVDLAKNGLDNVNGQVANKISQILENICTSRGGTVKLLAMNAPWIGGDDRIFNRLVKSFSTHSDLIEVVRDYYSLEEVIQLLSSSNLAIAMRYHGHLFCMALGIPFLSLDYTGKSGKVFNLVNRIDYSQWSESWRDFDIEKASNKLLKLYDERDHWSTHLKQESNKLVAQLQNTYSQIFDGSFQ